MSLLFFTSIPKCYFHTVTTASSLYSAYSNNITVMSNVTCVGDESRLIDCSYTSGGSGPPVSVRCTRVGMHEITRVSIKL